jgi:hypothetical protein
MIGRDQIALNTVDCRLRTSICVSHSFEACETTFTPIEPGAYRIDVAGVRPGAVNPVTASVLVWPPA